MSKFANTTIKLLQIRGNFNELLTHTKIRRALVKRFPHLVFYVVEATRVFVLAVLRTSRNPADWPKR
jgi:hypothetical protein